MGWGRHGLRRWSGPWRVLWSLACGLLVQSAGLAAEPGLDGRSHWAFEAVRRAEPPRVAGVASPVDRFLRAQLGEKGLGYRAPASRRVWLRRVTLDLTGLPPTPEAVAAFEADARPDAADRVVDALLASPAYGERWARWWLDVARYADTNGQDENKVMAHAWRYRDWVVEAFNADMPYDRFVSEQVAGDLMEGGEGRFRRWTATGFLVLGPKLLAEQDKPKLVYDIIDEQLDTVGRSVLGLTFGCARCHDHKYDPFTQREYYALAGIFRGTRTMENLAFVSKFNERRIATDAEMARIAAHEKAVKGARDHMARVERAADAAVRKAWTAALASALAGVPAGDAGTGLPAGLAERLQGAAFSNAVPGSVREALVGDLTRAREEVQKWRGALDGAGPAPGWRGGAFEGRGTNQANIPVGGSSTEWTLALRVRREPDPSTGETRRWLLSRAGNEWEDGHVALLLEDHRPGAYVNRGGGREKVAAAFGAPGSLRDGQWHHLAVTVGADRMVLYLDGAEVGNAPLAEPARPLAGPFVVGRRPDGYIGFKGRLDDVRIFGRVLGAAEVRALSSGDSVTGVLASEDFDPADAGERVVLEDRRVAEALWSEGGALSLPSKAEDRRRLHALADRESIAAAEASLAELNRIAPAPVPYALGVTDEGATNVPVLARGNHLNPTGAPVPRAFPAFLRGIDVPAPGGASSGRLELARWLTSPANPLTPRVLVNRVWQAHFGDGLVRTPENFGVRGEPPTHPELLDWLASEFVRGGWSLKRLHRWIVLSEAYRQDAGPAEASDPDNRLLHRFPRQRLEAETLRDALLSVSGGLDRAMGGSVVTWRNDEYVPGGEEPFRLPRRALYLPVVRDRGDDLCTAFDGANPSVPVSRRSSTVVASQALYLMNGPLVRECAERLAGQVMGAVGDDPGRVRELYRRVLVREPRESESGRILRALADGRLAGLGERERWTLVAQALLCSNEFIHRE